MSITARRRWALLGSALLGVAIAVAWLLRSCEDGPVHRTSDAQRSGPRDDAPVDVLAPAGWWLRATNPVAGPIAHLLFGDPEGRARLCRIERGVADPRDGDRLAPPVATCRSLEGRIGTLAALSDADPGAWPVVLSNGRLLGHADDDERVIAAHVARDGQVRRIVDDGAVHRLIAPDGARPLELRPGVVPGLVGPLAVHLAASPESDVLVVEGPAGRTEYRLPWPAARWRACRGPHGVRIVVFGPPARESHPVTVVDPSAPTPQAWPVGRTGIGEPSLACDDDGVVMSWTEGPIGAGIGPRVHALDCRGDRCTPSEQVVPLDGADPVALPLGGQVLLGWASRNTTRWRLGPLDRLATAADGPAPHPQPWRVLGRTWIALGDAILLVLRIETGTRAVWIDAAGRLAPVRLAPAPDADGPRTLDASTT
ncbi:MAG: hypothetical protein RMK74_04345 [Myxococcales bacterium]|nr:hypothetical protein [Myxococcales bacterium]